MKPFKPRTWKCLLLLASGLLVLAVSFPFDEPAPVVQAMAAVPPAFSWNDVFKGPQ
jgi:hypothetical protein